MCLAYIGFYFSCLRPQCTTQSFFISQRTTTRSLYKDGNLVKENNDQIDPCVCPKQLYLACVSQFETHSPRPYTTGCFNCRTHKRITEDLKEVQPSPVAYNRQFAQRETDFTVDRAPTDLVQRLMDEHLAREEEQQVLRERSDPRAHTDTQHRQIFAELRLVRAERYAAEFERLRLVMVAAGDGKDDAAFLEGVRTVVERRARIDADLFYEVWRAYDKMFAQFRRHKPTYDLELDAAASSVVDSSVVDISAVGRSEVTASLVSGVSGVSGVAGVSGYIGSSTAQSGTETSVASSGQSTYYTQMSDRYA